MPFIVSFAAPFGIYEGTQSNHTVYGSIMADFRFCVLFLQVNRDLHPGVQKHTSQSEEFEVAGLLPQGHNQTSEDGIKNLNALSDFILPETGWIGLDSTAVCLGRFTINFSGTGLLVQLLRTSISINAP